MRSPQEIVNELVSSGLDQHQLALLLELVLSSGMSTGSQVESPDDAIERRRKYDREYKRKRRLAAKVLSTSMSTGLSSGQVDTSCNLSSLLTDSQSGNREVSKKETDGVIGRAKVARGTRLQPDSVLSDDDRIFALENGVSDPDRAWAEFIDYWIGVPGQRGTKLNWSATWRNRVRAIGGRNAQKLKPAGDRAREFAARIREVERAKSTGRSAEFFGSDGDSGNIIRPVPQLQKLG